MRTGDQILIRDLVVTLEIWNGDENLCLKEHGDMNRVHKARATYGETRTCGSKKRGG